MIAFLLLNICIGSVYSIPCPSELKTCGYGRGQQAETNRAGDPRCRAALAAVILGGALALAGYLLQTFFHNPIAGPFVLGISSGAKMVVALVMVFFLGQSH